MKKWTGANWIIPTLRFGEGLASALERVPAVYECTAQQDDKLLDQIVQGRKYDYRKLLTGLAHHDVYHSGQIAYLNKQLTAAKKG